jgi:hypothetical protein
VCAQLEVAMKRHRGQPLPMEKKLQIVGELLQQRKEREALMASRAAARSDARRIRSPSTSLFGRTVDSKQINKLLTQLLFPSSQQQQQEEEKERKQQHSTSTLSQRLGATRKRLVRLCCHDKR